MNLPEQKAWARLFCEWFINRDLDECHETMRVHGREIAVCPHMTYYPHTRNEGTDGTFEQRDCQAYLDSMNFVSDEDCLRAYKWMREYCPAFDTYLDRFWNYLAVVYEGEER